MEMENGSILLAPQMRHILASLDSVASTASCLRVDSNPDLSQQSGSTSLSGRFNPPSDTSALNNSAKQAQARYSARKF